VTSPQVLRLQPSPKITRLPEIVIAQVASTAQPVSTAVTVPEKRSPCGRPPHPPARARIRQVRASTAGV
jgi:hypothetical protein